MRQMFWMASTATLALLSGQVHAQTTVTTAPGPAASSANQLEEIVVTAQKRVENIQDVPISIVAVSGATLAAAGVENASELSKVAPALKIDGTLLLSGLSIRIRGFGSPAGTATDSDVASYIDGVNIPRPGAILTSFLDVKSVEILNGPQGTLFGRNAAMGAISINTNAPSTAGPSLEVQTEGGSYGTYSGTAVGNLPVNDDFALRFAVKASHTDGFYHDEFDGKTYGRSDDTVGRLSAKWDVTPNLVWTLRADASKTTGDGIIAFAVDTNTATPAQISALTSFVTSNGGTPSVYSNNPSYNFNQAIRNPYNHDHQYGVTSDLNWNLSPILTVRLIDSYRNWDNKQLVGDTIGTSLDLLTVFQNNSSSAQSHELQLISSKDAFLGAKLGFTSGLYYFHENYGYDVGFNLGSQFCSTILPLVGAPSFLIPPCQALPQTNAGITQFAQSANSYAVYIQANYEILPNLELDLGGRETWDRKSASLVSTTPNAIGIFGVEAAEGPEALKFSDNRPSVRASLSWHVTNKIMVFATYSTGYKSGGFNSDAAFPALSPATRTFASETSDDYELGVKSLFWDGRALLNATLFDTLLHNFQGQAFSGTGFRIINAGEVRSRGLDIDGQFRGPYGLRLSYAATYLDSIYTSFPNAPGLEGCAGGPGCPTVQNLSGHSLDYAPKWQGNVSLEWKSDPFAGGYTVSAKATENYTDSFLTSITDSPESRLPGYATTDLNFSISSPGGRWKLDVFGQNIFDKHYYVNTIAQVLGGPIGVNNSANGATLFRGFLGNPARFGARLTAKF